MQSGVTFSPKKSKSKKFCSVFGCNSSGNKNETLRFHHFPRKGQGFVEIKNKFGNVEKVDRAQAWENVLRMGKNVSPYMVICSRHFTKEDYVFPSKKN